MRARAGGASVELCVRKNSHSSDACDRSMLSGIAVNKNSRSSSSHPVSSLRTAPALLSRVPFGQWNRCDALRVFPHWSAGVCCGRSVSLGFLRSAPVRGPCGAVSRSGQPGLLSTCCLGSALPVVWNGGGTIRCRATRPTMYLKEVQVIGGHCRGRRGEVQARRV